MFHYLYINVSLAFLLIMLAVIVECRPEHNYSLATRVQVLTWLHTGMKVTAITALAGMSRAAISALKRKALSRR
jgi:uncharacterized protein YerC